MSSWSVQRPQANRSVGRQPEPDDEQSPFGMASQPPQQYGEHEGHHDDLHRNTTVGGRQDEVTHGGHETAGYRGRNRTVGKAPVNLMGADQSSGLSRAFRQ